METTKDIIYRPDMLENGIAVAEFEAVSEKAKAEFAARYGFAAVSVRIFSEAAIQTLKTFIRGGFNVYMP